VKDRPKPGRTPRLRGDDLKAFGTVALAIRIHENDDAIVDAGCQAWKNLIAIPSRNSPISTHEEANAS
jgi:hypothetical protein